MLDAVTFDDKLLATIPEKIGNSEFVLILKVDVLCAVVVEPIADLPPLPRRFRGLRGSRHSRCKKGLPHAPQVTIDEDCTRRNIGRARGPSYAGLFARDLSANPRMGRQVWRRRG